MYLVRFTCILISPTYIIKDVANVKSQIRDASVDVQMEAVKGQDLSETIEKIRKQYEKAAQKSNEETQAWYQAKVRDVLINLSPDCSWMVMWTQSTIISLITFILAG